MIRGDRSELLEYCKRALEKAGFKYVTTNPILFQLTATIRTMTLVGKLQVTLTPGAEGTELVMRLTGNVDSIYALLFRSPSQKILERFKECL